MSPYWWLAHGSQKPTNHLNGCKICDETIASTSTSATTTPNHEHNHDRTKHVVLRPISNPLVCLAAAPRRSLAFSHAGGRGARRMAGVIDFHETALLAALATCECEETHFNSTNRPMSGLEPDNWRLRRRVPIARSFRCC
jgi:hypothetical protein